MDLPHQIEWWVVSAPNRGRSTRNLNRSSRNLDQSARNLEPFAIRTDPFAIWTDPFVTWADLFAIWTEPFTIWTIHKQNYTSSSKSIQKEVPSPMNGGRPVHQPTLMTSMLLWSFSLVWPPSTSRKTAMLDLLPFCLRQADSFKTEELANVALSLAKTFGESADVALPPNVAWPLESGGGVS
jgi:hypothetical protein